MGSSKRFLMIYGTETGQAKAISEEIVERCQKIGLEPSLHCFGKIEKEFSLEKEPLVVIVTSTTGDGEPPETVQKFWRRIKRKTISRDHFANMKYALLGLGDSNYSNFCNCAKIINERLLEIGASHFLKPDFADDATGLEIVVEPWIEKLLAALCEHFGVTPSCQPEPFNDATISKSETGSATLSRLTDQTDNLTLVEDSVNGSLPSRLSNGVGVLPQPDKSVKSGPLVENSVSSSSTPTLSNGVETQAQPDRSVVSEPTVDEKTTWHHVIPEVEESQLTLPSSPPSYIDVTHIDSNTQREGSVIQNNCKLPFANSEVYTVDVDNIHQLTSHDAVKTTLSVSLKCKDSLDFKSGDSFSILAENDASEVAYILERIGVVPDQVIRLIVKTNTTKKRAIIPEFINNPSSIRDIFTSCLDIRATLKKAFIRLLASFCTNKTESRQLLYLSSRQGADQFRQLITECKRNLLHILDAFKSCKPTLEALLENLPRLLPRPYSVACASQSSTVKFVFNVIRLPEIGVLSDRKGLVTGKFSQMFASKPESYSQVRIYLRTHQTFRLPDDTMAPLLLIGPGTGVAPFIGFLEDRYKIISDGQSVGECILFFGNRHESRDYLFRDDFEKHLSAGSLTQLHACFSRDDQVLHGAPRYVTDLMMQQADKITKLLVDQSAYIYVCGDAKNMAKDVLTTLMQILTSTKGYTEDEVKTVITSLRDEKRYKEDVWV